MLTLPLTEDVHLGIVQDLDHRYIAVGVDLSRCWWAEFGTAIVSVGELEFTVEEARKLYNLLGVAFGLAVTR